MYKLTNNVNVKHDPSFPGDFAKTPCLKLAGWVIDFSGLHLKEIPRMLTWQFSLVAGASGEPCVGLAL